MENKLLRRWEAARYLEERGIPISASTLAKKATHGGGPRFRKFDRFPLYSATDLDAWIADRLSALKQSTSDMGA